jgi:hypothetical protein
LGVTDVVHPALTLKRNALVAERLLQIEHVQNAKFVALDSFTKILIQLVHRFRRSNRHNHNQPPQLSAERPFATVFNESLSILIRCTDLLQQQISDGKFGYSRNSDRGCTLSSS